MHIVVPAKLNSVRYPRKAWDRFYDGKPMIIACLENALKSKEASRVTFLTGDFDLLAWVYYWYAYNGAALDGDNLVTARQFLKMSAGNSSEIVLRAIPGAPQHLELVLYSDPVTGLSRIKDATDHLRQAFRNSLGIDGSGLVILMGDSPRIDSRCIDGFCQRVMIHSGDDPATAYYTMDFEGEELSEEPPACYLQDRDRVKLMANLRSGRLSFSRTVYPGFADFGAQLLGEAAGMYYYPPAYLEHLRCLDTYDHPENGEASAMLDWFRERYGSDASSEVNFLSIALPTFARSVDRPGD